MNLKSCIVIFIFIDGNCTCPVCKSNCCAAFSVDSHATILNVNMGRRRDAMGEGSRDEVLNQWKKSVASEDTQAFLGGIFRDRDDYIIN